MGEKADGTPKPDRARSARDDEHVGTALGLLRKQETKPPARKTVTLAGNALVVRLPGLVPPSPNVREHWGTRARRVRGERAAVREALARHPAPALPIIVTLTRCAPRVLDGDNAVASMKAVRDETACWLGLESDADPGVRWRVEQARAERRHAATEIRVVPWSPSP
jgi:hypothetical protein